MGSKIVYVGEGISAKSNPDSPGGSAGATRPQAGAEAGALWALLAVVAVQAGVQWLRLYEMRVVGSAPPLWWRVGGVVPSIALASILTVVAARRGLVVLGGTRLIGVYVGAVLCVSLLVTVMAGNSPRYVGSDIFRFGLPWVAYLLASTVGSSLVARGRTEHVHRTLDMLAVLAVLDGVVTIVLGSTFDIKVSTSVHAFGIGWGLFRMGRASPLRAAVLMTCALAIVYSGKRGNLLGAIAAAAATVPYLGIVTGRSIRRLASLVGPFILIGAVSAIAWEYQRSALLDARERQMRTWESIVTYSSGERADSSFEGRVSEVQNVARFLTREPRYLPLGAGFGAVVPMYEWSGVESEAPGMMHQIHIVWFAYLLRNGLLGVGLLVVFYVVVFVAGLRAATRDPDGLGAAALFFVVFNAVQSLKTGVMLEEVAFPVVAGLLGALAKAEQQ